MFFFSGCKVTNLDLIRAGILESPQVYKCWLTFVVVIPYNKYTYNLSQWSIFIISNPIMVRKS